MTTPAATPWIPTAATELAGEIERSKIAIVGYLFSAIPMFDKSLPLMRYFAEQHGQNPSSPANIWRNEGSLYSQDSLQTWLKRVADSGGGPGVGLGPEILTMPMLYVMIRIGDHMKRLGLYAGNDPLTEFVRHLRNACAHGNRWHFQGQEPRHRAQCRNLVLHNGLHDQQAIWGKNTLLGPGDYLDVLDNLAAHLRRTASLPGTSTS